MTENGERRRLVLHFDVNETIMIGDPVSGIDFEGSLNNILAKVAIVRRGPTGKDEWHNGSPLDISAHSAVTQLPSLLYDFCLPEGCELYFDVHR